MYDFKSYCFTASVNRICIRLAFFYKPWNVFNIPNHIVECVSVCVFVCAHLRVSSCSVLDSVCSYTPLSPLCPDSTITTGHPLSLTPHTGHICSLAQQCIIAIIGLTMMVSHSLTVVLNSRQRFPYSPVISYIFKPHTLFMALGECSCLSLLMERGREGERFFSSLGLLVAAVWRC